MGAVAQTAKAVIEEAYAVACERRHWVCNEKRLIDAADLRPVHRSFAEIPADSEGEHAIVAPIDHLLGGVIFDFDVDTAYRSVFKKLDEMVTEMEELRG